MKTVSNFEVKGSKFIALAAFLSLCLTSTAGEDGKLSKAFITDFTSTGVVGFYIIGGIVIGGIILHIIVNHVVKQKDDELNRKPGNMTPHHHHRHHHSHRIVKKTS